MGKKNTNGLMIRDCAPNDYYQMARLRFDEKKIGFIFLIGPVFYSEFLKGVCESKWGFGKVCINEEYQIIGFVFASTDLGKCYLDLLLRRGFFLLWRLLPKLIKKPHIICGVLRYLLYPQSSRFKQTKAEWLSMVVSREYRNIGLGKKFTHCIINEFKDRGLKRFKSTVSEENTISCSIHEKIGFILLGQHEFRDGKINIYQYELKT